MESARLEKTSSYYGKELPEHLQDDLTKDILASTSMPPKEALMIANEEQKQIQEEKERRKAEEGDFMYQINNLERGKKLLDQSERTAKLYDRYKARQTKKMPRSEMNNMINKVSTMRLINTGGRKTRRRCKKKNRSCKRKPRKHYKKKRI